MHAILVVQLWVRVLGSGVCVAVCEGVGAGLRDVRKARALYCCAPAALQWLWRQPVKPREQCIGSRGGGRPGGQ